MKIKTILLDIGGVLVEFEKINAETKRKCLDFIIGVVFAIDGSLEKTADGAYIIAPNGVSIENKPNI